ncbi:terminase large subunit [Rhodobacter phage RcSaxon]|uniref:Terminase large subunit n=1 Tax=Rhodobacter phage RcSaxon TaxID=1698423 RepID=A0A0K1Y726_9CAUD|nr:terminase large subunit [Rhodobacter phage RcSaxon]
MLVNDAPEYRAGAVLPGFRPASDAIMAALPALSPPARLKVSEVARRRKINAGGHWQFWDNDVAPYMVEPMDATMSRRFEAVVFVGPARSSKTEGLIVNPWVHSVMASPRMAAIFYMSQAAAKEWSVQELSPIIKNTPELAGVLRVDNVYEKTFAGGSRLTVDWPVDNKLSGRTIPLVLLADYDQKAYQDVEGQGPAFDMGRKRTTSVGSRGMTVAESSPRFPVLNENWEPKTPHEAPPCDGILGLYNMGTRARLYWTCPHCDGKFEPRIERLTYSDHGTPSERGKTARMVCLHCGCLIEPHQKADLNRTAQWLHEGRDGDLVPLDSPDIRAAEIVSYWLHGPAAALASWAKIVTRYLEGVELFESTGDESKLKAATNLDLGLPYTPRAMSEATALSEKALRDGASDHRWQVVPASAAFLLAAVDVQNGRFVVQVMAHLPHGERVLVDRFDIHAPPPSSPRAADRQIDPARYGEDWDALLALADLSYPVAEADHRLRVMAIVTDAGGAPGVTPNAYAFYRRVRKTHPRRFHLVRGWGGDAAKRAEVKAPETAHKGKKHVAKDVLLIRAGTDRLKDEIAASLSRQDGGTRALHIPGGAPSEVFAEFAGERRGPKGWAKRPGVQRNEALDLTVYDLALAIVLGVEQIKWDAPPVWALAGSGNSFAFTPDPEAEGADGDAPADPAPARPTKKRRSSGGSRRRFDGW